MSIIILEIVSTFCDIVIWILYCQSTMINRKKISTILFIAGFIAIDLSGLIPSYYFLGHYTSIKPIVLGINAIVSTFILSFYYDISIQRRIYASCIYSIIICGISELLSGFILQIYASHLLQIRSIQYEMTVQFLSKFVQILFIAIIQTFIMHQQHQTSIKYNIALLVTPIISFFILITCPYPIDVDATKSISILVTIVGLFTINIVNYILLDNVLYVKELREREQYLQQQILFQENKYNQISTAYRNTRSILHETKRHFFYIQECADAQQYENITKYLKTAIQDLENSFNRVNTGNLVIDSFVSNHMSMAEQENITYETNINISTENIPIDDYNLCILLGNLLDNSIQEAAKVHLSHQKFVKVELFTSNEEFVIHIQNAVAATQENHNYAEYKLYHGYGLENVRSIVKQFHGTYSFTTQNNVYDAIIIIPNITSNRLT